MYNPADVGQANGNASILTAAYVIDATSPEIENPLLPDWDVRPLSLAERQPEHHDRHGHGLHPGGGLGHQRGDQPGRLRADAGAGCAGVSSFDPATSQTFGAKPQFWRRSRRPMRSSWGLRFGGSGRIIRLSGRSTCFNRLTERGGSWIRKRCSC